MEDLQMSKKRLAINSTQWTAIALDILGIILVLVGATIARNHAGSGLGVGVFWAGFILLIVSLILFVYSLYKAV